MSARKTKTPGWAAFDPNKPQKQVTYNNQTHSDNDPYPPISSNIATLHQTKYPPRNVDHTRKSFSSVLTHSTEVPNMIASETTHHNSLTENSQSKNNISQLHVKLMELHPWANENLIEDILSAVDNDINNASKLLRDMAPLGSLHEKKETEFEDKIEEVDLSIKNDELLHDRDYSRNVFLNDNIPLGFMMDLSKIPMEPEWEEDDTYLIHRKEAIRAMRLASRHSKASTEAYLRSDHAAAQEFSQKAREEWSNAEKLNAKAAKEILATRNCENDDWKLDLHGLHAAEAVQALLERLLKIESQLSGTHSSKSDKTKGFVNIETNNSDKQHQLLRPRLLEVITGKGSHSRGEAALPVAIKSFLSEKGYYFYEARVGVITVQPKFRQLTTALSNA